ncbi:MAG: hypothetical protein IJO57_00370 [Bacilli bacterium]|nr:hypothetical protein [Bacilli bacterium]
MKKKNNYKHNKLFNYILLLTVFLCVTLTIGYSAYESTLYVDDTLVTIRPDKDVRITSAVVDEVSNESSVTFIDYDVSSVYSDVTLPNQDSSITYKINVKNYGNVEVGVSDIIINDLYDDILMVSSVQLNDKIRDLNGSCEDDVNGCKLNIDTEFNIILNYKEGMYDSSNTSFENLSIDIIFAEAFNVEFTDFDNLNLSLKDYVALKGGTYKVNIGSILANENLVVFMNGSRIYNFLYQNGILTVPDVSGNISISKEILEGTYYNISYQNITNVNYPTSIREGETLLITFTDPVPGEIHVLNNDNFTYENGVLTVSNITSDITIVVLDEVDLPLISTDENTATVTVKDITTETPVQVSDLLNREFGGQNINEKIINKIDVVLTYTSGNGGQQSINCFLKIGDNDPLSQPVQFDKGQTTATTVTVSFTGLSLGQYENFNVSTSIANISHGKVQIQKMEIIAYYADNS